MGGFVKDPEGLISYWRMEDAMAGSSVVDATGLGFSFPSTPAYVTSGVGKVGNAAYVALPGGVQFQGIFATSTADSVFKQRVMYQALSISAWFYYAAVPTSGSKTIRVGVTDTTTFSDNAAFLALEVLANGETYVYGYRSKEAEAISQPFAAPTVPTGTWVHCVVVFDPFTASSKVYLDNSVITTSGHSQSFLGERFTPGLNLRYYGGGETTGGVGTMSYRVDEIGIWNRALTDSQVSFLYNSGAGRAYSEITF
jgi:hypothetical protein